MKYFASYGSLKKGFWNHDRFNLGEPIATSTVKGAMFVNPNLGYPFLYQEADKKFMREYEVEIYKVEDRIYNMIDGMESGAGYYPIQCWFKTGNEVKDLIEATVWFQNKDYKPKDEWFVEDYKKTNP